jgi:iron complex outermembrane receptor protein
LYYEDPANLGNPELEPETALTYELGLKYANRRVSVKAAGFVRSSDNLIDWTKENEDDQWFPSNVGDIEIRGIEFNTSCKLTAATGSPTLSVNYTYLDGQNRIDAPISRYALDIINHQFNLGLAYAVSSKWNHSTNFRYVDRLNLDNYTVIDSRLSFKSGAMTYGAFVNNLFDTRYTETSLVPMPGRWLGFSLKIEIR